MRDDLDGMAAFAAVAERRSFRVAGEHLGVSASAVSQGLRRLEDRLGLALLQRTTRSVRLTEAGARLHAAVGPALAGVQAAVAALGDLRGRPAGTLRLRVSSIAEEFLAGPTLPDFLTAYPDVRLDVVVSDDDGDVVAAGFDAGVGLVEAVDRDMIAVAASAAQRQVVVAAPAYLACHGAPAHPRELTTHACVGWRRAADVAPYRWEFTEPVADGSTQGGRDFTVAVAPRVTTNDMALMVRLACAGVGLTTGMEETFRSHVARGELVPVLEAYCAPFPGFALYYPRRRHAPPPLRALVDHMRGRTRAPRRVGAVTATAVPAA